MKKIILIVTALGTVLAISLLSGCGSPSPPPGPTSTPAPTRSTDTPAPVPTTERPTPSGEIWQWALGRDVWNDPALQRYAHDLGRSDDTDVNVQSEGFQLTVDSTGTVTAVTLYNNENALGLPGAETNFSAYEGTLPMGLSWNDTASDIGAEYGAANQSGGYGTSITFAYTTNDGYRVDVAFLAGHESDLPASPIHSITVSRV